MGEHLIRGDNSMGKSILVTGFAPFGGESINPSFEAVKNLPDCISGVRIVKRELPVTYAGAPKILKELIEAETGADQLDANPLLAVICFGQAGRSDTIRIEQLAVNEMTSKSPDNDGVLHNGDKIAEHGPDSYETTLPTDTLIAALTGAQLPASRSFDAGKYVCNTIFYNLMGLAAEHDIPQAGFVHVPYAQCQVQGKADGTPFMTQEAINEAVRVIINEVVTNAGK